MAESSAFDEFIWPIIAFSCPEKCAALEQSDPRCNEKEMHTSEKYYYWTASAIRTIQWIYK